MTFILSRYFGAPSFYLALSPFVSFNPHTYSMCLILPLSFTHIRSGFSERIVQQHTAKVVQIKSKITSLKSN